MNTAQRRAAELAAIATEEILDAINQLAYPGATIKRVVARAIQDARRDALEEAVRVVEQEKLTDNTGKTLDDLSYNLAIRDVLAALDRLREGV